MKRKDDQGVPASGTRRVRTQRELLRRRRRERQVMFFGVLVIALATVFVAAGAVFSGRIPGPFSHPFVSPDAVGGDTRLVCPPADAFPLDPSTVVVRVLNSTDRSGLARGALNDLVGRGYVSGGATNWNRSAYQGVARISFGAEGVHDAYTVAREFPAYELVLDNRSGRTVDVVVGLLYDDLVPLYDPSRKDDVPLSAAAYCLPAEFVIAEPAPAVVPEDPTASPEPSVSPSVDEDENLIDPADNLD